MSNFKLNFLHVCEQVIIDTTGNISVINIFNQINSLNFPAIHPKFCIFCNIIGYQTGRYDIEIIINNENVPVATVKGKIEIASLKSEANFIANFINFRFDKEGDYGIEVKVDGNKINDKDYIVKLKKNV